MNKLIAMHKISAPLVAAGTHSAGLQTTVLSRRVVQIDVVEVAFQAGVRLVIAVVVWQLDHHLRQVTGLSHIGGTSRPFVRIMAN
jgi:hypothetical protein